jgi:hypothetical protein
MADFHGRRVRVAVLLLPNHYLKVEELSELQGVKPAKWIEDIVIAELAKQQRNV